ncbi:3411_t:CDS:1, partial [Cetraspora pellucida]
CESLSEILFGGAAAVKPRRRNSELSMLRRALEPPPKHLFRYL